MAGTAFRVDEKGAGLWVWKRPEGGDYDQMIITRESRAGLDKHTGPLILTANLR